MNVLHVMIVKEDVMIYLIPSYRLQLCLSLHDKDPKMLSSSSLLTISIY